MKWPLGFVLLCAAGCARVEGPRSALTADEASIMRDACAFAAGTPAGLSVAKDAPLGGEIPIDTIIVIMMENRSFDHLLGALPELGVTDADVAPPGTTNLDSTGAPVARFHLTDYCFEDTAHSWRESHKEWNGGKNDGFVTSNEHLQKTPPLPGDRAMGYFDQNDLPFMYGAATTFAISDRHFCGVLGPTQPNRNYLYAATSYGRTTNDIFTDRRDNLVEQIEAHNARGSDPITWRVYHEAIPGFGIFLETLSRYLDNVSMMSTFYDDAAAGTLPNVVLIDANLRSTGGDADSFHPPGNVQLGDAFLARVYQAVASSPQWKRLAVVITFDEHGGLYDHVPPPPACAPDGLEPEVDPGETQYDFARHGFRVPLVVISPWAKPGYVSHHVTDHTSITRFIETRFRLPAITARDANAEPITDLFDFTRPAFASAPGLPMPVPDPAKAADCAARFP